MQLVQVNVLNADVSTARRCLRNTVDESDGLTMLWTITMSSVGMRLQLWSVRVTDIKDGSKRPLPSESSKLP